MIRAGRALALLVLVALVWLIRELRSTAFKSHLDSQRYEDVYYLPPAQWLPLLSFGFREALADLIWCRSMVYFGEELGQKGAVKYMFDYSDAVITLDPDFKRAYRWAAVVPVSRPVDFTMEEGLRGAAFLERAIERWPNDGELHWEYAALLRFELAPFLGPGPEKDRLLGLAAPHLVIAASLGAGPPWLALNSSSLLERLGRSDQLIRHLEEVYPTVSDERTKREIEARLARLRTASFVEALKTANAEFERSRAASYPYLSPGLFMLIGPRLAEDWHQQVERHFLSGTQVQFEEDLRGEDGVEGAAMGE